MSIILIRLSCKSRKVAHTANDEGTSGGWLWNMKLNIPTLICYFYWDAIIKMWREYARIAINKGIKANSSNDSHQDYHRTKCMIFSCLFH